MFIVPVMLRIKDVAERSGFSPAALRYYEELGLLPAPNGRQSGAPAAVLSTVWAAHGRGDLTRELVRARREELLRVFLETP